MRELSIDDFNVSDRVKNIFKANMISSPKAIIQALEFYKFIQQPTLVKELNAIRHDVQLGDLNPNRDTIELVKSINQLQEFNEVCEKYNVAIDCSGNAPDDGVESVRVILPIFSDVDKTRLELDLSRYRVQYVYVTYSNFKSLIGDDKFESLYRFELEPRLVYVRLVMEAISLGGTDLHVTVEHHSKQPECKVYYRRGEILCPINLFELTPELCKSMIYKTVENDSSKDSIDLFESYGVVTRISDLFKDGRVELRLSANKVLSGYDYVARIQELTNVTRTIETLGFPEKTQEALNFIADRRAGLTFITGPLRTGKTTTLFALANKMATAPIKIKSYEDPVEALMPFPQVDYKSNPDNLVNAIRVAKKQDIDVALLNEIPDKSVAFAVQDLVNSSIYVLTTIHINRIWHLPYKLIEYYGANYKNIISQINGVFNQKMFDTMCDKCCNPKYVKDLEDERKKQILLDNDVTVYYEPQGCSECFDLVTGTSGVIRGKGQPYCEYLLFTDEIKSRLLQCAEPYEMEQVIKTEVIKNGDSLEAVLSQAISDKKLQITVLDSLF